jgi:hypothetical protein
MKRASAAVRGLAVGTALAAGAAVAIGGASAASAATVVPVQDVNATGTIVSPSYQTFTGSSSGTSPAHVALSLTQTGAFTFSISSTFSDSTAGATVESNDASTTDVNAVGGAIIWMDTSANVDTGTFEYENPGTYQVTDTVTDSNGATATAEVQVTTLGSAYAPVTPTRILDTRKGLGAPKAAVNPGSIVKLHVEGTDSIPASGVTAVVLNVTAVAATGSGFITVYPSTDGTHVPDASDLNYTAGKTVANLVTVPVGADGYVYLANSGPPAGPVNLIADVSGYYSRAASQLYNTVYFPQRVLDTRKGIGAPEGAVPNGGTVKLLTAQNTEYLPGPGYMNAAVVNITVVNPTGNGYVAAYADGTGQPGTSTLNYTKGQTVANSAIVPVAANGEIDLTNEMTSAGSAQLLVDVAGYFEVGADDMSAFVPITPSRVFDSRKDGEGQIENGIEYDLGLGDWAQGPTVAIEVNATVTDTRSSGFLSLFAETQPVPSTSNLNWIQGQTVANSAFFNVNEQDGWISLYNGGGAGADVILDVSGYFQSSFA